MKQLRTTPFRGLTLALAMVCTGAFAQKQTKTYKEEFKIEPHAVIDINTSYADIQFETWDKNEVVVEGIIELEGATEDEARAYFENSGIEILGNSKTVEIRTSGNSGWARLAGMWPSAKMMELEHFHIPDVDAIIHSIDIPEIPPMPEMPPLPPMPDFEFDYEAFKKDGEKYMKKWKKEFNKSFDKEYQEKMEAWGREFAARAEARKDLMEERREAMEGQRAEMQEQREKIREQAMKDRERVREEVGKVREQLRIELKDSDESKFFFRTADGESRSYKVKKTIKVKMPKSAILKMNVRHGEVKLAANTRNIRATLSYARLHAASIEGDDTQINAAYTPVKVAQWKYGNLNTSFTDQVELDAVTDLNLNATSSEVRINKLIRNLISRNDLGALYISTVDPSFKKIDIEVRNGEMECVFPNAPFAVSVKNTQSDFNYPASWVLKTNKEGPQILYTGNSGEGNADRVFKLNTAYSSVVLQ